MLIWLLVGKRVAEQDLFIINNVKHGYQAIETLFCKKYKVTCSAWFAFGYMLPYFLAYTLGRDIGAVIAGLLNLHRGSDSERSHNLIPTSATAEACTEILLPQDIQHQRQCSNHWATTLKCI